MTITINFKPSTGTTFELQVESTATVAQVKQQAAGPSGVPESQMRLIYKGRILKDAETIEQNKIESGHTLHLVKGPGAPAATAAPSSAPAPAASATPTPAPAPTTTPSPTSNPPPFAGAPFGGMPGFGMGDPTAMAAMMQNPAMQQMMAVMSQNPELMATMLRSNPQFQAMAAQNPHLNLILQNPDLLRIMLNPQMMQAAMQMQQAVASMGSGAGNAGSGGAGGRANQAQALMQLLQQNPDLANAMMQGGGGDEGEGAEFNAPPPPAAMAELEERYREQLEQMALMGFTDRIQNIEALRVCDGNVEAAINYLFTYGN